MDWYKFITEDLPIIIQTILTIIGALKVLARYTPWKWDDALFNLIDKKDNVK